MTSISFKRAITRAPDDAKKRVFDVCEKYYPALWNRLRKETGLVIEEDLEAPEPDWRNGPEAQVTDWDESRELEVEGTSEKVSVVISPNYPTVLESIEFQEEMMELLNIKDDVKKAINGGRRLLRLNDLMGYHPEFWGEWDRRMPTRFSWLPENSSDIKSLIKHLNSLLHLLYQETGQVLRKGHVLGVYRVRDSRIELYGNVIWLIAEMQDCTIEQMALVVLTHELAHAYTHIGVDADGETWSGGGFERGDPRVIEGLAQYYTHQVLKSLGQPFKKTFEAYEKMLPNQSEEYRAHKKWLNYDSKIVRKAMLEARKSGRINL